MHPFVAYRYSTAAIDCVLIVVRVCAPRLHCAPNGVQAIVSLPMILPATQASAAFVVPAPQPTARAEARVAALALTQPHYVAMRISSVFANNRELSKHLPRGNRYPSRRTQIARCAGWLLFVSTSIRQTLCCQRNQSPYLSLIAPRLRHTHT